MTLIGSKKTDNIIKKFSCDLNQKPPYVIVGFIQTNDKQWRGGILSYASNEIWAHLIKKEFLKFGVAYVEKTEWHPTDKCTYNVQEAIKNKNHYI